MEHKKIWIAGHTGLVGSALVRRLHGEPCEVLRVSHKDLDLTRQAETEIWIARHKPDAIIMAAARVGGIEANRTAPADFLSDNLAMAQNVIHGAYKAGVPKLLFLGSSCIYPRMAPQPIREVALMTGPLEETNEWYAIAKIAGLKLCQAYRRQYGCDFISAMPTNLYGPGDRFEARTSHVIPALMMKIHAAKLACAPSVKVWGTGNPLREFLYADDLADALVFMLRNYAGEEPVNVGSGQEISIAELVRLLCDITGYRGEIVFDPSMPDGAPRKRLDCEKLGRMGWTAQTDLRKGLEETYSLYCAWQANTQVA